MKTLLHPTAVRVERAWRIVPDSPAVAVAYVISTSANIHALSDAVTL